MKNHPYLPILAASAVLSLGLTGCIYVHTSPQPTPVQTVTYTSGPYVPGYVVTTLPNGYTTTVYHGATYYTHNGVYYRTGPRGYTVVTSPY